MQSKYLSDFDHVSALADGALSGETFTAAAQATLSDPQAWWLWVTLALWSRSFSGYFQMVWQWCRSL
jgi:hypothetical protein